MADENTTNQQVDSQTPEAAGDSAPAGQESQQQEERSVESYRQEVEKLRRENAKYRTERNEYRTDAEKFRQLQEDEKSELQKATEKVVALEAQAKQAEAETSRLRTVAKFGIAEETLTCWVMTRTSLRPMRSVSPRCRRRRLRRLPRRRRGQWRIWCLVVG